MRSTQDTVILYLALGVATYLTRISGFWLMGMVRTTPRIEAALKAAPLAVMIGIVAPAALRGGMAEAAGLAVTTLVMYWRRHDLTAALAGVVVVAALRVLAH